ncbi:MAG: ABC transporter ATP-binding protein [Parvibaculaceae bacterium]
MEVRDLRVAFDGGGFAWKGKRVRAVNGVSLTLNEGETLGLVGESGCGKTTLARAILGLHNRESGEVMFDGRPVNEQTLPALRRETAMIFQDPFNALNPRMRAGDIIAEVLRVQKKVPATRIAERVNELLSLVGLSSEHAARKPSTLSGGQCQRVGIARALAVEPRLIIADECVSALDVSIQAQIINLLIDIRRRMKLAMIFIAHDLAVVRRLCDRIAVMYLGRTVEEGAASAVFSAPQHPYTQALLRAIPEIDPGKPLPAGTLQGEPPSPVNIPPGCPFHPRCPEVFEACRRDPVPMLRPAGSQHAACLLYGEVRQ